MANQLLLQNSTTGPGRIHEHCVPCHMKPGVMERWKGQILLNLLYPGLPWDVLVQSGEGKAAAPSSPQLNLPFHVAQKLSHSQLREV